MSYTTAGADGRVTAWNADAQRLFGWPAVEAVGRPLTDLIIPQRFRPAHDEGMRRDTGISQLAGQRLDLVASTVEAGRSRSS